MGPPRNIPPEGQKNRMGHGGLIPFFSGVIATLQVTLLVGPSVTKLKFLPHVLPKQHHLYATDAVVYTALFF